MAIDPEGELLTCTQRDVIQDEMIVTTLEADQLTTARALPNYTLRTRRPELYGELIQEQVKW